MPTSTNSSFSPVPHGADARDDEDKGGAEQPADKAEKGAEEEVRGDEPQDTVVGFGEQGKGVFETEDFVDERGADGAEKGPRQVPHHVVGGGHLRVVCGVCVGGCVGLVCWLLGG